MNEFPERLRKLRERNRLKRYILSELCGLSPDAVRRYECGEAEPTMNTVVRIAEYFEVSVDYLIGRSDYPTVITPHRLIKKFENSPCKWKNDSSICENGIVGNRPTIPSPFPCPAVPPSAG